MKLTQTQTIILVVVAAVVAYYVVLRGKAPESLIAKETLYSRRVPEFNVHPTFI